MRSYVSVFIKAGFFTALAAAILPGQALAQLDSCNAQLSAATGAGAGFYMGEPIPIVVDIGAGEVLEADGVPDPGYLDIYSFQYQLDCSQGDSFPSCTDGANDVQFVADNLTTTCEDQNGPITFMTEVVDKVVTFTPGNYTDPSTFVPSEIRNDSGQTCEVAFEVLVNSVADENVDQEIVELTGWVNTVDDQVGVCSNGLVASAAASVSFSFSTMTSWFTVTKDFLNQSSSEAHVFIDCDAGLPLDQDFMLGDGDQVSFTVRDFPPGELDCHVFESPVPEDYEVTYTAGIGASGVGDYSSDADGCYFNNVVGGQFICDITNDGPPGEFTVIKEWLLSGSDSGGFDLAADVTIYCDAEILEDDAASSLGVWYVERTLLGETDSVTITIDTTSDDPVQCWAVEEPQPSMIGVDNGCAEPVDVTTDGGESCTIANSVYYEGIPTLDRYGIAVLVLLTLGVGMVGFRRYL